MFFSCFSHKDRCGVLMTNDNLCPFWGICVPSLINISCHLVVLWMLSIFILVFKVIKTFYGVSVYMGVYVYVCIWVSFLWTHYLQLICNASTLFDCCRFSVRFEMVGERPFSFFLLFVVF